MAEEAQSAAEAPSIALRVSPSLRHQFVEVAKRKPGKHFSVTHRVKSPALKAAAERKSGGDCHGWIFSRKPRFYCRLDVREGGV